MYNNISMQKFNFNKKRRFRVVAISDCPVPTYRLELEYSFEDDPDDMSKSWLNELLVYNDNFAKILRLLCVYLDVEVLKYDFFADEKEWIYFEE